MHWNSWLIYKTNIIKTLTSIKTIHRIQELWHYHMLDLENCWVGPFSFADQWMEVFVSFSTTRFYPEERTKETKNWTSQLWCQNLIKMLHRFEILQPWYGSTIECLKLKAVFVFWYYTIWACAWACRGIHIFNHVLKKHRNLILNLPFFELKHVLSIWLGFSFKKYS